MTRNDFFNLLMNELCYIPEKQLQNIISYYNNLFENELQKGKSEEDIIENLGDLSILIANLKSNSSEHLITFENKSPDYNGVVKKEKCIPDVPINNYNSLEPTESKLDNISAENSTKKYSNPLTNNILRICILVLSIFTFFPVLSAIAGFILSLFGTSLGLFTGSLGILVGSSFVDISTQSEIPQFISSMPHSALVFLCLGTMCLGILLFFALFYLSKAVIHLIRHIFIKIFH